MLAVAVVTAVNVLTARLERALDVQGQTLLAANRVLESSQPISDQWRLKANDLGLKTATTAEFASMVFAGEAMHLASVKAVSPGYPLLGEVTISQRPFAVEESNLESVVAIPSPGTVWVDSRLLPLMALQLGDYLEVGEKRLSVAQVLIEEPDRGGGFGAVGARVMMNASDMAATEVVQPGSRVRYRLLLAGESEPLAQFERSIASELSTHQRFVTVEDRQQGLARSMKTGKRFLLLTAMMAVMLAGVAIAITGRSFCHRQVAQVALLKSLGAGRRQIRSLYLQQLLFLGLITSLAGVLLGAVLQAVILGALEPLFPQIGQPVPYSVYFTGVYTGVICLVGFTLPNLWYLPAVAPVTILRQDTRLQRARPVIQALVGLLTLLLLTALFSLDMMLITAVGGAVSGLVALGVLLSWSLRKVLVRMNVHRANWRLALGALRRSPVDVAVQITVFALALMLLLSLAGLKTSLIADWQRQIPQDSPNHFLFNIAPYEIQEVSALLRQNDLHETPFYPMVRARLTRINDDPVSDLPRSSSNVLRREVNLSWAEQLGSDNKILQGQWWPVGEELESPLVSVESEVASELNLQVGDSLEFSIGGLTLSAAIASVRSVHWESMNPNFYFLLSPGALDDFAPMALTSVYIAPDQKAVINDILQQFPTVVVIEMDRVIAHIQSIVDQVSTGVSWMLWVVLVAGALVLWAAVNGSLEHRKQDIAVLRALGAARRLVLSSIAIEFALIGLAASLLAVVAAEGLIWALQTQVLDIEPRPHGILWVAGLMAGVTLVSGLGVMACRPVTHSAPMGALRTNGN